MSIKNDGHYFCRAGGNRPDGLNEPVTYIKGLVEVKFDIGADGTVTRIVFLRSEPHNLFRDEVVKAMAKWRFEKNRPCQGVKRQFIFTPSRP
ncbi:TonB family protein [Escherichia coli]|uniref:TonB family protein n=1 Tax=Escherichia coli TaxID=562 RepID=UPI001F2215EA|nr:TonB family protein [Escherichia coli]MCF3210982.1 TonB family protein [Escherichia coli]